MGVLVKNGISYTGSGDILNQPVIYSDSERCIGVWRDGKPLYQKTIEIIPSSQTYELINYPHNIENVKQICSFDAYLHFSSGTAHMMPSIQLSGSSLPSSLACWIDVTKTDVQMAFGYDRSSAKVYCTIRYTKTTDTAGTGPWAPTGATPTHYSLEEQVIGTWIDGKPLYQKTFSLPGNHINDDIDLTSKGLTSNIDSICTFTGIAKDHYGNCCNIQRVHNVTTRLSGAFIQDDKKTLSFRSSNDDWVVDPIVTLQYTKTTD